VHEAWAELWVRQGGVPLICNPKKQLLTSRWILQHRTMVSHTALEKVNSAQDPTGTDGELDISRRLEAFVTDFSFRNNCTVLQRKKHSLYDLLKGPRLNIFTQEQPIHPEKHKIMRFNGYTFQSIM
jgi:hypothetical protein